jgi:hypothetical protein
MAENKEARERVRALVKEVLANVPVEEEIPTENFPKRVVVNSRIKKSTSNYRFFNIFTIIPPSA